jgi:hypothetical protein
LKKQLDAIEKARAQLDADRAAAAAEKLLPMSAKSRCVSVKPK